MLAVKNLSYGPPHSALLQENLNFSLSAGEVLHLTGENGSGKSLLARVILGLSQKWAGEVKLSASFRYLTQMHNKTAHLPYSLQDVMGENSLKLLPEDRSNLGWNKASGGERQRALLTYFFSQPGDLLVLDEPFNHLDAKSRLIVQEKIREELKNPKQAVLLISHDDDPGSWLAGAKLQTLELR